MRGSSVLFPRAATVAIALALLAPSVASAQAFLPPAQAPRKEGFSIGVLLTTESGVGKIVSLRVGTRAGDKAGVDFDIGYRIGRTPQPTRPRAGSEYVCARASGWIASRGGDGRGQANSSTPCWVPSCLPTSLATPPLNRQFVKDLAGGATWDKGLPVWEFGCTPPTSPLPIKRGQMP